MNYVQKNKDIRTTSTSSVSLVDFEQVDVCWYVIKSLVNSGSLMMRVASINQHWWYDRRLSTYDTGSVGNIM